jgi:serine protease inhibitor
MMARTLLICMAMMCLMFTDCSDGVNAPARQEARELTAVEAELVTAGNSFGIDLFKEIVAQEREENIFVSPLSVSMALGMVYNGAAGGTEAAMRGVLGLGDLTNEEINEAYQSLIELLGGLDRSVTFGLANSIWYRLGLSFEEDFINTNRKYFDAEVSGLDFSDPSAAPTINGWVDRKTNGRIEEIVDSPIDADAIMFLINAIYFKGAWTYQFDPEKTYDGVFKLPDGSESPSRMMSMEDTLHYQSHAEFQAVDLPYGNGDFRMVIVLPASGTEVDALIGKLSPEVWDAWLEGFQVRKIILAMPKFTMEYEIKLNDVLSALGMEVAFLPSEANFTRLYNGPGRAFISEVKHKTFVKVDEEGTEAAAVTSVGVSRTSLPPMMVVDRPFLFAIRESHSGTILFVGKIVQPTLE